MPDSRPIAVRQRLREYPTPKVADVIIREKLNTTRKPIPAIGSAHPDAINYPNHILVHVSLSSEDGHEFLFHYAANRSNQEDYNGEYSYVYGGDPAYPRITRTYILPRGNNELDLGSEDPGGPVGTAGTVKTSTGGSLLTSTGGVVYTSTAPTPILVAQWEKRLPQPLDGMYVEVTRVYDVIPGMETPTDSSGASQADGGYVVQRPIQNKNWLKLTWNLTLPRETADSYRSDSFSSCPIAGYTNLKLVDEVIKASEENNQVSNITRVYVGKVSGDDSPSAPVIRRRRELPGIMPPSKFLSAVIERTDTEELLRPADASVTSWTPPAGYVLMAILVEPDGTDSGRREARTGFYGEIATLTGKQWDENLRDYVDYTVTVMSPADAAAFAEVSGAELTITPLNCYWSQVTIESPRETTLGTSSRVFYTTVPFTWPAVLIPPIQIYQVPIRDSNGEVTDSYAQYVDYTVKKAWSGICKAKVEIAWQKTNYILSTFDGMEFMRPESIEINWPILRLSIPATLHAGDEIIGTTGNNHPEYGYVEFSKTIDPTNYLDWPPELITDFSVTPYKGGYRIEKTTVYRPEA